MARETAGAATALGPARRSYGEPDGSVTGLGDRINGGGGADFVMGFYGDDDIQGENGPDELSTTV
jgi:hypothetical protein